MPDIFEQELKQLIESDRWMMNVLKTVKQQNLNDCWVGAGFVRNKVWDIKHHLERSPLNDIDVIFYDKTRPECIFEMGINLI